MGDKEAMLHQVKVEPSDQDVLRFLAVVAEWRPRCRAEGIQNDSAPQPGREEAPDVRGQRSQRD